MFTSAEQNGYFVQSVTPIANLAHLHRRLPTRQSHPSDTASSLITSPELQLATQYGSMFGAAFAAAFKQISDSDMESSKKTDQIRAMQRLLVSTLARSADRLAGRAPVPTPALPPPAAQARTDTADSPGDRLSDSGDGSDILGGPGPGPDLRYVPAAELIVPAPDRLIPEEGAPIPTQYTQVLVPQPAPAPVPFRYQWSPAAGGGAISSGSAVPGGGPAAGVLRPAAVESPGEAAGGVAVGGGWEPGGGAAGWGGSGSGAMRVVPWSELSDAGPAYGPAGVAAAGGGGDYPWAAGAGRRGGRQAGRPAYAQPVFPWAPAPAAALAAAPAPGLRMVAAEGGAPVGVSEGAGPLALAGPRPRFVLAAGETPAQLRTAARLLAARRAEWAAEGAVRTERAVRAARAARERLVRLLGGLTQQAPAVAPRG